MGEIPDFKRVSVEGKYRIIQIRHRVEACQRTWTKEASGNCAGYRETLTQACVSQETCQGFMHTTSNYPQAEAPPYVDLGFLGCFCSWSPAIIRLWVGNCTYGHWLSIKPLSELVRRVSAALYLLTFALCHLFIISGIQLRTA